MPKSHAIKRRYKTKMHYGSLYNERSILVRTKCGKLLEPSTCTLHVPDITCKSCRSGFRYWWDRSEQ